MLQFERTEDLHLVREILVDPRCWRRMTDDLAPRREEFEPTPQAGLDYIVARDDDGTPVALFVLVHRTSFGELHFCYRPRAWGKTLDIARGLLDWIWRETVLTWLIGPVPEHNRLALRLAKEAGFTEFCREKHAVQKNGKPYDRILMSITRPEFTYRREAAASHESQSTSRSLPPRP